MGFDSKLKVLSKCWKMLLVVSLTAVLLNNNLGGFFRCCVVVLWKDSRKTNSNPCVQVHKTKSTKGISEKTNQDWTSTVLFFFINFFLSFNFTQKKVSISQQSGIFCSAQKLRRKNMCDFHNKLFYVMRTRYKPLRFWIKSDQVMELCCFW